MIDLSVFDTCVRASSETAAPVSTVLGAHVIVFQRKNLPMKLSQAWCDESWPCLMLDGVPIGRSPATQRGASMLPRQEESSA